MLKIHEITDFLETKYSLELACDWDKIGLQIGDYQRPVRCIMVVLEATSPVIDEAITQNVDLIITHHPFIFASLTEIDLATPKGKNIEKLIKNDISLYSMHTNYDIADGGMNSILAEILALKNTVQFAEGIGRIGQFETEVDFSQLLEFIKTKFGLDKITFVDSGKKVINKIAIIGGSGGDYIDAAKSAGADVLITGDIKYHTAIDAQEIGLNMVDIGHYAEAVMEEKVKALLTKQFNSQLDVLVPTGGKNPLEIK